MVPVLADDEVAPFCVAPCDYDKPTVSIYRSAASECAGAASLPQWTLGAPHGV